LNLFARNYELVPTTLGLKKCKDSFLVENFGLLRNKEGLFFYKK